MTIDAMARFNISPSRIARYYFHECERHLRYASTPHDRLAAESVPDVDLAAAS